MPGACTQGMTHISHRECKEKQDPFVTIFSWTAEWETWSKPAFVFLTLSYTTFSRGTGLMWWVLRCSRRPGVTFFVCHGVFTKCPTSLCWRSGRSIFTRHKNVFKGLESKGTIQFLKGIYLGSKEERAKVSHTLESWKPSCRLLRNFKTTAGLWHSEGSNTDFAFISFDVEWWIS